MPFQKTLIIIKPDTVARSLMGKVISRFEEKGLVVAAMKMARIPVATARKHYAEHSKKPFFGELVSFITKGPVILMAIEGIDAVEVCRAIIGKTNGRQAAPGTIRGDYGMSQSYNLVHGSDSPASAKRELALFFKKSDYVKHSEEEIRWNYDFAPGKPI